MQLGAGPGRGGGAPPEAPGRPVGPVHAGARRKVDRLVAGEGKGQERPSLHAPPEAPEAPARAAAAVLADPAPA